MLKSKLTLKARSFFRKLANAVGVSSRNFEASKYPYSGKIRPSAAFTLVELLVVISIIGILTAIVTSSTSIVRAKSRDVRRISDLKSIQLPLGVYFSINKAYPSLGDGGLDALTDGGFLSSIPHDPVTDIEYPYSYDGALKRYCLGTILEDTSSIPSDNASCSLTCTDPSTHSSAPCNYTVRR